MRPTKAARAAKKQRDRGERPRLAAEKPHPPEGLPPGLRLPKRHQAANESYRVLFTPPLPVIVECPDCGFLNEVTEAVIQQAYRPHAGPLARLLE